MIEGMKPQEIGNPATDPPSDIPSFEPTLMNPYEDNSILQMAYGNIYMSSVDNITEDRLQRLERGVKSLRRGRIMISAPIFKSQRVISQTSGNNPFKQNIISGISYPPGIVPDVVATFSNSNIKFPTPDFS